MIFRSCSHERELLQALRDGHWPRGCGEELRTHVKTCASCADVVLVTQTFQKARAEYENERIQASPSLLWWRAQLQRRNAVTEQVSRPLKVAQSFAFTFVSIVAVWFAASQYRNGLHWASWWSWLTRLHGLYVLTNGSVKPDWNLPLLIPTLGGLAVLSGLVVYLVYEKS